MPLPFAVLLRLGQLRYRRQKQTINRCVGLTMGGLSKRDWLVLALFAFVTIGTAIVILNWLIG